MPPEVVESPRNPDSAVPVNNDNRAQNEPEAIGTELGEAQEIPENGFIKGSGTFFNPRNIWGEERILASVKSKINIKNKIVYLNT